MASSAAGGRPATPREREMRALVSDWRSSGQPLTAFARDRGVTPATLSWWRWALRRRAQARRSPAPTAFVGVEVVDAPVAAKPLPFEVVLRGRRVVRVPAGFDAVELARLLGALEPARC